MCGRFNLTASPDEIAEEFDLDEVPELRPRFNIAPSQPVATIGIQPRTGRRGLAELRWGFESEKSETRRPGAAPRPAAERRHINARSETVARSPAFREAFARRRCLIPATGFYEWKKVPGSRPQPWLFRRTDGRPFAFAGLWAPAHGGGASPSCLILTTEPNDLTRAIHDRMPVIVAPGDYAAWLDPTAHATDLQTLLRAFPAETMTAFPVSRAVNSPAVDDPSCLEPAPPDRG